MYQITTPINWADGYHESGELIELDSDEAHAALGITANDVDVLLQLGAVMLMSEVPEVPKAPKKK